MGDRKIMRYIGISTIKRRGPTASIDESVNFFGCVDQIVKPVRQTRNNKFMLSLKLIDDSGEDNRIIFHLFTIDDDVLRKIEVGDILRLQRVKLEMYNNMIDGRIFSCEDMVVFKPQWPELDPIISGQPLPITERQNERVLELREWYTEYRKVRKEVLCDRCQASITPSNPMEDSDVQLSRNEAIQRSSRPTIAIPQGPQPGPSSGRDLQEVDDREPQMPTDILTSLLSGNTESCCFRLKGFLLDIKPNPLLDPMDMVSGFCYAGCRKVYLHSCVMWRPEATGNVPLCPECAKRGQEHELQLTFMFELIMIDTKGIHEAVLATRKHAEVFLNCSVAQFMRDEAVRNSKVRLLTESTLRSTYQAAISPLLDICVTSHHSTLLLVDTRLVLF